MRTARAHIHTHTHTYIRVREKKKKKKKEVKAKPLSYNVCFFDVRKATTTKEKKITITIA